MLKTTTKRIVERIFTLRACSPVVAPLLQVARYASRSQYNLQNLEVLSYGQPHRAEAVRLIRQIHAEREMLLNLSEAYSIFAAVKQTAKVPGGMRRSAFIRVVPRN